ncbi:MAG: ATP-binding protein [Melioribacteraceae bacterium]|nr:ATP-binding protein [Melioribacteraceae bacterium]
MSTKRSRKLSLLFHDINNIFARIVTSTELLKQDERLNLSSNTLLKSIENSIHAASELLDEFKSQNENTISEPRLINMDVLLSDLIAVYREKFRDRIEFSLNMVDDLYQIKANHGDLYRLFLNLIVNASEAIKSQGAITIRAVNTTNKLVRTEPNFFEGDQSAVCIEITDTGEGIEPEIIDNIFEENFSTKNKKNSGLGLAIVKNIVGSLNGSIDVSSVPNHGTKFSVTLPAIKPIQKPKLHDKKRILIAEDDSILRELLRDLLASYDYEIIECSTGEEVINLLGKIDINLFIIDHQMPGITGINCIEEIRNSNIDKPIILATGAISKSEEKTIETLGISDVFKKPYVFDIMLNRINELTQNL